MILIEVVNAVQNKDFLHCSGNVFVITNFAKLQFEIVSVSGVDGDNHRSNRIPVGVIVKICHLHYQHALACR